MNSDKLLTQRFAALVFIASAAPGQTIGRTAAVKLLYFLQELFGVPLGYYFRLYTYGPFDNDVLHDLGTAVSIDALTEEIVYFRVGYGYAIKPGKKADAIKRLAKDWLDANRSALDSVAKEFGSCSAADLELGSTVLFVDREFKSNGSPSSFVEIAKRVQEIKPNFSESTILSRVNHFLDKGWLKSISQ
jgi:uncharacterized protein